MSRIWKFLTSFGKQTKATSSIDPIAQKFNYVADEYDRSRPTYSAQIFDVMDDSFKSKCNTIVDVGAGTGQLTSLLINYFNPENVYAIEPLQRMREKLISNFELFDNVSIFDALSDNLSFIDNNSVDAIFCGTSFHWFANIDTMKEFERILSPNGSYLIIVWNQLEWEYTEFFRVIRQIINESTEKDNDIRRQIQKLLTQHNLHSNGIKTFERFTYKQIKYSHEQTLNGWTFLDLIRSKSCIVHLGLEARLSIISQVEAFITRHYGSLDVEIVVPYTTIITYAKCNKSDL